ncbi:MAG: GNAT family N-acetyltransferase [Betaproteobacteria bacterium]
MLAQLSIVDFVDLDHAEAFRDLNLEWINEFFFVEDLDKDLLNNPRREFIDSGGAIVMALLDKQPVGCCGLLKHGEGVFEVSKMAVRKDLQGRGIGRLMMVEIIARARSRGASALEIISSTKLAPALKLYRSFGFEDVPLQSDAYERGNIALRLCLENPPP